MKYIEDFETVKPSTINHGSAETFTILHLMNDDDNKMHNIYGGWRIWKTCVLFYSA